MTDMDFLNAIIDDATSEIETTYLHPNQKEKRDGALKAYADASAKTIEQISELLSPAQKLANNLRENNVATNYWYWRMYVLQIEWIENVYSAMLHITGRSAQHTVTLRGATKAYEILGIDICLL